MHLQENTFFDLDPMTLTPNDLDLGVKVTWKIAQFPLHHVTYLGTKFEVVTSNGLGGDTFTKIVTDGCTYPRTDRRMEDRLWYEINTPFFSKEKAGKIKT